MSSNRAIMKVLQRANTASGCVRDLSMLWSSRNRSNDKGVQSVHTFYLLYTEIFQSNTEEEIIILYRSDRNRLDAWTELHSRALGGDDHSDQLPRPRPPTATSSRNFFQDKSVQAVHGFSWVENASRANHLHLPVESDIACLMQRVPPSVHRDDAPFSALMRHAVSTAEI